MKKPLAIQLSIPAPCRQSWDDMKPEGNGRHCAHCEKVVVDFTRMTDAQLLDYFKKNEGGCGKFTSEQLNRTIQAMNVPRNAWWAQVAAGVLLAFGLSKNADGQIRKGKAQIKQHQNTIKPKHTDQLPKISITTSSYNFIRPVDMVDSSANQSSIRQSIMQLDSATHFVLKGADLPSQQSYSGISGGFRCIRITRWGKIKYILDKFFANFF